MVNVENDPGLLSLTHGLQECMISKSCVSFEEECRTGCPPYCHICHIKGQQIVGCGRCLNNGASSFHSHLPLGAHNWLYILKYLTSTADHIAWITLITCSYNQIEVYVFISAILQ